MHGSSRPRFRRPVQRKKKNFKIRRYRLKREAQTRRMRFLEKLGL